MGSQPVLRVGWSRGVLYYYWQIWALFVAFIQKYLTFYHVGLNEAKKCLLLLAHYRARNSASYKNLSYLCWLENWFACCLYHPGPFYNRPSKDWEDHKKAECQNTECQITDLLKMPKKWSKTKISSSHDFVKYGSKVAHGKSSKQKRLLSLPIYQGLSRERRLG